LNKVKVAGEAGFQNIGILAEDVVSWRTSGMQSGDLHRAITDYGMKIIELCEVSVCDEYGHVADRAREFAAASGLGASVVSVSYNGLGASLAEIKNDWAKFLHLLSDVEGVRAALHFRGDSQNMSTLESACEVVSSGPPNGCLLLDVYDFWRGDSSPESLNAVPVKFIGMVHLSDVKNIPREKATITDRILPGHGVIPLTHIISTLVRRGYRGPFLLDIIGESQSGQCQDAVKEACRSVNKLLGTSGPSHISIHIAAPLPSHATGSTPELSAAEIEAIERAWVAEDEARRADSLW
jgi:sugar phosphate isomerase/epimerase